MSNTRLRGRVMWVLATSRPDLGEVDLKRPGRVDVKIPLFPAATPEEGFALLQVLARRHGVNLEASHAKGVDIPDLLTPGAAEALAVKIYRLVKTEGLRVQEALARGLEDYCPPVDPAILLAQIDLAEKEASDVEFVPTRFRRV
jgi:hypothetical protein